MLIISCDGKTKKEQNKTKLKQRPKITFKENNM